VYTYTCPQYTDSGWTPPPKEEEEEEEEEQQ